MDTSSTEFRDMNVVQRNKKHSNTAIHTVSNFPNIYSLNAEQNVLWHTAQSTEHRVQFRCLL